MIRAALLSLAAAAAMAVCGVGSASALVVPTGGQLSRVHAVAPAQLAQITLSEHGIQADPTGWRSIAFRSGIPARVTILTNLHGGKGSAFVATETFGAAAALNALLMASLLTPG